jgi:hypothetical protein
MNPKISKPSAPITYDKEISTSHPVVGESLPSSFPYIFTSPVDTNPTMSSSIFVAMSSLLLLPLPIPFLPPVGLQFLQLLECPLAHRHHPLEDLAQCFILEWDVHRF